MKQKAYSVIYDDVEIIFYREKMMNQIQNISLKFELINKTFHPRIANPHPHLEIHNKDEGTG